MFFGLRISVSIPFLRQLKLFPWTVHIIIVIVIFLRLIKFIQILILNLFLLYFKLIKRFRVNFRLVHFTLIIFWQDDLESWAVGVDLGWDWIFFHLFFDGLAIHAMLTDRLWMNIQRLWLGFLLLWLVNIEELLEFYSQVLFLLRFLTSIHSIFPSFLSFSYLFFYLLVPFLPIGPFFLFNL